MKPGTDYTYGLKVKITCFLKQTNTHTHTHPELKTHIMNNADPTNSGGLDG